MGRIGMPCTKIGIGFPSVFQGLLNSLRKFVKSCGLSRILKTPYEHQIRVIHDGSVIDRLHNLHFVCRNADG